MTIKKTFEFSVNKDATCKAVEIEGFANKATADRIGDLIEPKAWDVENFKNNPIIFFNHDRNIPIGKAVGVEVTDEGLKIKVRLSKSKEAPIPMIRDLVEEGILKTFSVGFDDHDSSYLDKADGLTKFEKAELLETSIVTLPMNQDSLFTVSKEGHGYNIKQFTPDISQWKKKSYDEIKKECLELSGSLVAAAVNDSLKDADPAIKEIIMEKMSEEVKGRKPWSDQNIKIASALLDIDRESLLDLRRKENGEEEEKTEEVTEEKSEDEKTEEAAVEEKNEDEAKAEEKDEEKDEDESKDGHGFNDCVAGKIPKLIEGGKDRDEAIAIAIEACGDSKSCEIKPEDFALFLAVAQKAEEGEETTEKDAGDGVAISTSPANGNMPEGQPGLELQKSQLALSGAMLTNQKAGNDLLMLILDQLKIMTVRADQAQEPEEEKAVESQIEDTQAIEQSEGEKAALAAITKNLEQLSALNKRLDKIL